VCGPTVYSYAHIGNARSAVAFDLLFRLLRATYGADAVVYARNITDVDDKIIAQAMQDDIDMEEITGKYAAIYREDMAAPGVRLESVAADQVVLSRAGVRSRIYFPDAEPDKVEP